MGCDRPHRSRLSFGGNNTLLMNVAFRLREIFLITACFALVFAWWLDKRQPDVTSSWTDFVFPDGGKCDVFSCKLERIPFVCELQYCDGEGSWEPIETFFPQQYVSTAFAFFESAAMTSGIEPIKTTSKFTLIHRNKVIKSGIRKQLTGFHQTHSCLLLEDLYDSHCVFVAEWTNEEDEKQSLSVRIVKKTDSRNSGNLIRK